MSHNRSGVVVVGVDGSASSVRALVAGLCDARSRHLAVEIVTAWSSRNPRPTERRLVLARAARRRALRAQTAAMAAAVREVGDLPPVSAVIVEGDPAEVLTSAAKGADALVLGRCDHQEPAERHTLSLSERCVRWATCPVVVVPSPTPSATTSDAPRGVSHVGT